MTVLGDNLSIYQNLEYFSAKSPEELKAMLGQIKLPFKIISIYSVGSSHVAWVNLTRPVKKKKTNLKIVKEQ